MYFLAGKEGNYSMTFDQERFECIDRLWLEQRLHEIDGEAERDPITLETQLSDNLKHIYDFISLTRSFAAALLIGESNLINIVMNTIPFCTSPRVPQLNQIFRADRCFIAAIARHRHVRKSLGSFDRSTDRHKTQASALSISPPAPQSPLKRGPENDLGVYNREKRTIARCEPESEDMRN